MRCSRDFPPLACRQVRLLPRRFNSRDFKMLLGVLPTVVTGFACWLPPPAGHCAGFTAFGLTGRVAEAHAAWLQPLQASRERACRMPPVAMRHASHEAVLGVRPGASLKELKAAYRERVKQCHPDLNPSKAAEFHLLTTVSARPALLCNDKRGSPQPARSQPRPTLSF